MFMNHSESYEQIREAIERLCADFPGEYWRKQDEKDRYPTEFVQALIDTGYLSVLIPEEYGGSGLDLKAACIILETIHKSGGNGAACHAQMYTMGTLLRHGSNTQKEQWLPGIADGSLRLQAFGVTEPSSLGYHETSSQYERTRRHDALLPKICCPSSTLCLLRAQAPFDCGDGRAHKENINN